MIRTIIHFIKSKLFFLVSLFMLCSSSATVYAGIYATQFPLQKLLTDGKMHVFLCGTGDPELVMQDVRKPACLAILANNQFLLFDAGEGSIQTLANLGLPYQDLHTAFITHWHSDHIGGLGPVVNGTWVLGRTQPFIVYGPFGVKQAVDGINQLYQLDATFRGSNGNGRLDTTLAFAQAHVIDAEQKPQQIYKQNGIAITAFKVEHPPVYPALGYEIQYKGCKVVISGDTNVNTALATESQNTDVLISEALSHALEQQEIDQAEKTGDLVDARVAKEIKNYHADSWDLAKMAEQTKVKNLVLTHLVPSIPADAASKQAFIAGMNQYYHGPIQLADDRDQITLTSTGKGNCQVQYIPS